MNSSVVLSLLLGLAFAGSAGAQRNTAEHWVATWGTAQQMLLRSGARRAPPAASVSAAVKPTGPARRFGIPPTLPALHNQTIRMVVHTSIGGSRLRVRLSNALGGPSITLGEARIGIRGRDSSIVSGSDRPLTFSGSKQAVLYAGEVLVSDPVDLEIPPLADLAVSLYLPGDITELTSHRFGLHTTYISTEGNHTAEASIPAPASTTQSYYWLAGIDVLAPADAGTVVTFGDSITDGDQSTPDTNGMWPAILAERLQSSKATAHIAVVNAGISGNRLLGDNASGLVRLFHDALEEPGIRWMTLLEGINDITAATRQTGGSNAFKADDLIAAYRQIIELAHMHGVEVIGCTLTPYGGSPVYTAAGEAIRETVNQWIRTSHAFDAVIDFDAAMRNPADPQRYSPKADSPDLLHPTNAGYKMMGDSIDLSIFNAKHKLF